MTSAHAAYPSIRLEEALRSRKYGWVCSMGSRIPHFNLRTDTANVLYFVNICAHECAIRIL